MEINLKQALDNGCRFAIIDEEEYYTDGCSIVKDVKEILQKLIPTTENNSQSLLSG